MSKLKKELVYAVIGMLLGALYGCARPLPPRLAPPQVISNLQQCDLPRNVRLDLVALNNVSTWDEFEYWNQAVGMRLFRRVEEDGAEIVIIGGSLFGSQLAQAQVLGEVAKTTCPPFSLITIDTSALRDVDPDHVRTLLRHEIGHVLGLDHSKWESDLMYVYDGRYPTAHPVDASDAEIEAVKSIFAR